MASISAIYNYTPTQALVIGLYDEYRTSLINAKYYARRLESWKRLSLITDLVVAIASSTAFASLVVWKS